MNASELDSGVLRRKWSTPYGQLGFALDRKNLRVPELECGDPQTVLKKNFRWALLQAHPDKGGSNEECKQVMRAYAYLAVRRDEHDAYYRRLVSQGVREEKPPRPTARLDVQCTCGGNCETLVEDLFDELSDMFGL